MYSSPDLTYSFSVFGVWILWFILNIIDSDSHFSKEVLCEVISIGELENFGVEVNFTANIEVLCCVVFIIIRSRFRDSVSPDQCTCCIQTYIIIVLRFTALHYIDLMFSKLQFH